MNPANTSLKKRVRLPSIESQTLAYVEAARRQRRYPAQWLDWGGFRVFLRYQRFYRLDTELQPGEVLVIASVEVPERYQRRGWFWRYCQLCASVVKDGLVLESVLNEDLAEALRRRPCFVEYEPGSFMLRKQSPDAWPFALP